MGSVLTVFQCLSLGRCFCNVLKKINPKFEEKALVTLTHGTQKVDEMLHFTLRNIAWCISKCCFEVLCEIVVLYITLRNVTLYSLKYSSMKKRMLQKTLGGQSSFSLSLICRADLVRHISQRTQFFFVWKKYHKPFFANNSGWETFIIMSKNLTSCANQVVSHKILSSFVSLLM